MVFDTLSELSDSSLSFSDSSLMLASMFFMLTTNSETFAPIRPISSLLEESTSMVKSPSDMAAILSEIWVRGAITRLTTQRIKTIIRAIATAPTINRSIPIWDTDLSIMLVGI